MPERRDTLFKGRPKIGLDFFNAPRQRGNRTKCLVHSMGYGLCVDVQKSGTTQIQNVLDKGYNLIILTGIIDFITQTGWGDCIWRLSYRWIGVYDLCRDEI